MVADKLGDFARERKGADAQRVDRKSVAREQRLSLVHSGSGRAVVNDPDSRRLSRRLGDRAR
jgi:hypothetical protein